MFKYAYLLITFSLLSISSITAQFVWYENSSRTNNINFSSATRGEFTTDEINPEKNSINSNATVSKFVRDGVEGPRIRFNLKKPITDLSSYTISLKAHTSIPTTDFNTTNSRIRISLRNSSIGGAGNVVMTLNFTEGETWESFSFDFDGTEIPAEVISAGGYNQLTMFFASGDDAGLTSTYHIDAISGSSDQLIGIRNAAFLSGSWGVRFNLRGGFRLDNISDEDFVAGAQEIADNLPAVGHIITNATNPAQGYLYTLRDNPYVDVANEIHPAMVPTLENEQIILDVIDVFKQADKKVILYLNGAGPGHLQGDSDTELEILAAWEAYYNREFDGDEALAWRTLAKGYVERFKGLADGYWLDNLANLPGKLSDFVAMIREVDPNVAIATNGEIGEAIFLTDENNEFLYVDSDSFDDEDPIDYMIKNFLVSDPYMDFTGGHPTSLGKGAPPNSWAYEEFLFPLIVKKPWGSFDGSKEALKHYFCPIRDKWSSPRANLMFEEEQAYRFVRTLTDAGATITWSNTLTDGFITDDEMEIMQEINDRMVQSPKPDPVPYVRPEGAFLVGEQTVLDNDNDGFTNDVDCDDSNAAINPSAPEIANSGFDENCDGVSLIIDNDNDGFNSSIDCDDNNASINAGAPEIANNGIDEDCNGSDLVTVLDNDNDGFTDDVDCDDSNAAINPSAPEIANSGFDENCDGVSLIIDNDNDGFNSSIDCDDNNASINSGAAEIANNGIDEDCNGSDLVTVLDNDNDGFTDDVDCDDSNAAINPDAEEISGNEIDENCDGELEMTTNTLEQELAKSLKLYPNPTNGMIYLKQNEYLCEACKIEVLDYFGRIVLQQVTTNADLIPIDVRSLNSGLLIVRISTDYGSVNKRIILVK